MTRSWGSPQTRNGHDMTVRCKTVYPPGAVKPTSKPTRPRARARIIAVRRRKIHATTPLCWVPLVTALRRDTPAASVATAFRQAAATGACKLQQRAGVCAAGTRCFALRTLHRCRPHTSRGCHHTQAMPTCYRLSHAMACRSGGASCCGPAAPNQRSTSHTARCPASQPDLEFRCMPVSSLPALQLASLPQRSAAHTPPVWIAPVTRIRRSPMPRSQLKRNAAQHH